MYMGKLQISEIITNDVLVALFLWAVKLNKVEVYNSDNGRCFSTDGAD